jgi:hypothetical protein
VVPIADYLELPLVTDSDALLETAVRYLEDAIPGFVARPGNVEVVLLEAFSQLAAEVVEQAGQVDPAIFAYHGSSLVGVPITDATPATGTATVTWAADTPAAMLPAGSQLAVPHPSGEQMLFVTDSDVVSVDGGGVVPVGVTAAEPGSAANGAFGAAEPVEVVEGVATVDVATTGGGSDEEDPDEYLDRLADAYTILAPRPILPGDHATLVRQLPGVGRALAIDLLLPGTSAAPGAIRDPHEPQPPPAASATTVPRCTTVAVTDADGAAPTTALLQQAWALLDASREVNFLNFAIAPTYSTVAVQATVTAWPGFARADVAAEAAERLAEWLNPLLWGTTGASDATEWSVQRTIRVSEAIDYLNRATSVAWADLPSIRLKAGAGAWQATDLTLAGLAPLPTSGPHEITVKLPGEP